MATEAEAQYYFSMKKKIKEDCMAQLEELLRQKNYEELVRKIREIWENQVYLQGDTQLTILYFLTGVYEVEKGVGCRTVFEKTSGLEDCLERYTKLKFCLRRLDFDIGKDALSLFRTFSEEHEISEPELLLLIQQSVVHKEKVQAMIGAEQ